MKMEKNDDTDQFKKLFIGGLHLQTTDQSLKSFYEKWGEVVDCIVMKDPVTRRSRGFGFITYSEAHMVDDCLAERPHIIDDKQVDPKRAMPREESNKPELHQSIKKVFIGGIKEPLDENDIREHFSKFGNIESIDMVTDKDTGKKRGFCFMTYDDTDSVDKIVLIRNHTIKDITVEVKKAVERDGRSGGFNAGPRGRGGRGAMMGGRGSYGGGRQGGGGGGGYGDGYSNYGGGGYNDQYNYGGYGGGGWNQGAPQGAWNQGGGYGNGYGPGGFGSGYGAGYGGGVMKNTGYTQRATGPYGGGYGSTGGGAGYGGGAGGGGYGGQR